jgi:hypothetical protein
MGCVRSERVAGTQFDMNRHRESTPFRFSWIL